MNSDSAHHSPSGDSGPPADAAAPQAPIEFSADLRCRMIALARESIRYIVLQGTSLPVRAEAFPEPLHQIRACFVTLFKEAHLRGCIGHILPRDPLYQAIVNSATSAATRDWRFPAVVPAELDRLRVEISILTPPRLLVARTPEELLALLEPHKHGVVLKLEGRTSTFLPQVWDHVSGKVDFLNRLARKANREPDGWRSPDAEILVYEVDSFAEHA